MRRLSEAQLQLGVSQLAAMAVSLRGVRRSKGSGARRAATGPAAAGHAAVAQASTGGCLPPGVLGITLLPSLLDLLGQLQREPLFLAGALWGSLLAALALGWSIRRRPSTTSAAAAALVFALSAAVRVAGQPEGALFALLGLAALGAGGAFHQLHAEVPPPQPAPAAAHGGEAAAIPQPVSLAPLG